MTVPDDRAVGGLLTPNQTVDVFVTANVNVLTNSEDGIGEGRLLHGQVDQADLPEHADPGQARTFYVLKAPIDVAMRSPTCRPAGPRRSASRSAPTSTRQVDASRSRNDHEPRDKSGYGLPIPVAFPPVYGPVRRRTLIADSVRRRRVPSDRREAADSWLPRVLDDPSQAMDFISAPLTRRASRPPGSPSWWSGRPSSRSALVREPGHRRQGRLHGSRRVVAVRRAGCARGPTCAAEGPRPGRPMGVVRPRHRRLDAFGRRAARAWTAGWQSSQPDLVQGRRAFLRRA